MLTESEFTKDGMKLFSSLFTLLDLLNSWAPEGRARLSSGHQL